MNQTYRSDEIRSEFYCQMTCKLATPQVKERWMYNFRIDRKGVDFGG